MLNRARVRAGFLPEFEPHKPSCAFGEGMRFEIFARLGDDSARAGLSLLNRYRDLL